MASIAQRNPLPTWLEPEANSLPRTARALVQPEAIDRTRSVGVVEQLVELAVAIPAAIISAIVPFVLFAGAILLFPFLPFLTPIFAAPLVLLLSLTIRAFGAVLAAIGWL